MQTLDIRLRAGVVGEMSETFQSRIVAELFSIFEDSETFDETKKLQKAAASMMLGDCHIYGFGIEQDAKKMLWKVYEAASAGLERARIWYPRLRQAFKGLQAPLPDSPWGMSHISSWPSTSFLPMLIQDNKEVRRQMARQHVKPSEMKQDEIIQDDRSSDGEALYLETFAEEEWDCLGVLHQAAWIGDQDTVGMLLHQGHAVNVTTPEGRTPLYYACLAGDLLMVKALLSYRADPTLGDRRGITPLHLCIMFDDQSAEPAVSLLVQNGGCLSARTTTTIRWRMYDLELKHEPLNWAIQTRNKNLVSLLIKAGAPLVGLNDAVRYFLPEIMDILLSHGTTLEDDMPLADAISCLDRPHRHWLLHGNERLSCIHQTLDICEKYGCELKSVLPRDIVPGRSFTFLGAKIITAQMEEDFVLVIECIRRGCDVKETGSEGSDALALAIRRDRRSYGYLELLDLLVQRYSAEELNQLGPEGDSYLLTAIEYKSPEALELLLRYGADPNLRAGFTKESPFEACIHHIEDQPGKFLQLLINYGADALRSGPRTREFFEIVNPNLFRQTFSKLEALFELDLPKETVMEYVQGALRSWFIPSGPFQERDGQRWAGQLLCHPKVHSIINERDADGLCLLHHAVIDLIPANVSLLLEAGAKSDEVINGPETVFTALHLVILYGRLLAVKSKRLERFQRRRQGYFQVATLLLEDYRAIKSEWFAGITKLHIACYLRLRSEIRKALAEGYDPNARGKWPTNGDLVTAKELFLGSCSPPLDGPYLFLLRERDLDFIQGVSKRRHHELQIDSDSMVRSMFGWQ
ncbi:ankyrin repeat-containing domain protein [Aspergillus aurantiobrunneus]